MVESKDVLSLLDCSFDLICVMSKDGTLKTINKVWADTIGSSKVDILSKPFVAWFHPDDIGLTTEKIASLSQGTVKSVQFENRIQGKDGKLEWLSWNLSEDHGRIFGIAKNITELKENEAYLKDIQEQAKIGGWTLDVNTLESAWTDETYRIYALPLGTTLKAEDGINFYHPDYREKISECVRKCIEEKQPFDEEFRFITAKKRHIWVRSTGRPVLDNSGEVIKLAGTFQDIDVYKIISETLENTTRQFQEVLKNSPGMVYKFQLEPDGHMFFPYVSPQAFDIYEIMPEDFIKNPAVMLEMCHPEDRASLEQRIGESAKTMTQFEWGGRILTANGKTKWIKAKSRPRLSTGGAILWNGIVLDVSHETALENDLLVQRGIAEHSARLASIGELAAGVGHEINNPLAIVLGLNSKMGKASRDNTTSPESLQPLLEKQKDACFRIKKIVNGLRSLSHSGDVTDSVSDLTDSVKTTLSLIEEIYSTSKIKIETSLPTGQAHAVCNATHVQQVLMNLLTNAKDALADTEEPVIRVGIADVGDRWVLSVQDNGKGIPAEVQPYIFRSFFTTKEIGNGTGIGLALSRSIVVNSGGSMSFESDGNGSTFHAEFIKSAQGVVNISEHSRTYEVDVPLKVLVVDDEEDLREILADILSEKNCTVTQVDSADKALTSIRTSEFDVILTDKQMPGMDGLSFLSEVTTSNLSPLSIKAVITGGDTKEIEEKIGDFRFGSIDACIEKPFDNAKIFELLELASRRKSIALKKAS